MINGPDHTPVISLSSLGGGYVGNGAFLKDLNWQVGTGERVGLVGPNGAGKTTLLLTLSGVIPPSRGKASVAGCDLGSASQRRMVAQSLGLLMQDPDDQLLEPSVEEDIALGPAFMGLGKDEIRQRVEMAIAATGLEKHRDRVPQKMSLGEKKRVALAGVLARKPEIILLDEPTAGLDPRGRRELISLLQGLEATLVVATHDLEMVLELCHQAVLLDSGSIAAIGHPTSLLGNPILMESHGLEVPWPLRPR